MSELLDAVEKIVNQNIAQTPTLSLVRQRAGSHLSENKKGLAGISPLTLENGALRRIRTSDHLVRRHLNGLHYHAEFKQLFWLIFLIDAAVQKRWFAGWKPIFIDLLERISPILACVMMFKKLTTSLYNTAPVL
ncbi:MAG: hypothetical protein P8Y45_04910 [Exilibacterium sp.]